MGLMKTKDMDMTEGSLLKKLIICAAPLIFMNILQLLFNMADIMVLGAMVNDDAVAAVGNNGSLINLITNLFIGLGSGASVVLAKCAGAHDEERAGRVVGTSVILSLIGGFIVLAIGVSLAEVFFTWMKCPAELMPAASAYFRIYMLGMPIILFYNFAASLLRAVGDTFRPLIFLLIGGVLNVGLNIFFIKVVNLTVEGVAIATIASQAVSAIMCLIVMIKNKGLSKLRLRYLKIYKNEFKSILGIGLPSGVQSVLFSISNVMIQTNINVIGASAMSGNAYAAQFDAFAYTAGNSVALANMSFVSQNVAAGKVKRVKKVVLEAIATATVAAFAIGLTVALLCDPLISLMTDVEQVHFYARERLNILGPTYFLCGILDTLSYTMRGLGRSLSTMIISFFGICVFRAVWLYTVCLIDPMSMQLIFLSYPVSWILNIAIVFIYYQVVIRKTERALAQKEPPKVESEGV